MDRFAFFIIIVAIASVVYLILAFTVASSPTYALVLSTALATVAVGGCIIYCVRRKPKSIGEDLMRFDLEISLKAGKTELTGRNKPGRGTTKEVDELPLFSFSSVSAATNNFSDANKLGEGGFGPVYKGVLLKGNEIAVKRLSGTSRQGFEELKNEATVIAKVQHKNLVRLLGCCIEKDEKILIYEYMPNKSLDFFLFGSIIGRRRHI
ncbi:Receptor-like serine/threonine-protein kinase [Melia azedarach]|uniref:Receptor-like serine/threonine-protein kinase n=1 Tax=Melia azedarach TaxID=155640 RepID=A0ACC1Y7M7_MELAZ|nr:Receptor-like serine/threonine-protein kinase [Melia azedarach]